MKYFKQTMSISIMLSLLSGLLSSGFVYAENAKRYARFDNKGKLIRPTGYREWIFTGAPLTPNELNNGKAAFPEFHSVYIDPASWAHWKKTGEFRDGTLIIKELVSVGSKSAASGKGYFMGEYIGLEAMVKDKKRFSAADKHWGFFRFTKEEHPTEDQHSLHKTSQVNKSESCAACHSANAKHDLVFLQYYPVLRAGQGTGEKGTGGK